MNLKRISFDEIAIRYEFQLETTSPNQFRHTLIAKFAGHYREGSAGNPDASFILGIARTAVEVWHAAALVLDLSELQYQWGDEMEHLLPPDIGVPAAVVVGPGCARSIATLLWDDVNTTHEATEAEFLFANLQGAWEHVMKKT